MPKPPVKKKRLHCSVQLCGYNTLSWTDLSRHMRKHTGEKPYQCDKCDKRYSRQDKLLIHKRVHDGRRPFACPHCKYTTVDSSGLKKHVRTHTGQKPYKCGQCSYTAKDASQLVVHVRKHTGDSPYLCMVESCGAAFKAASDLKRHLRRHTGEKPFKCVQCNFEVAVKSNLTAHVRKHHGPKPPTSAGTRATAPQLDNDNPPKTDDASGNGIAAIAANGTSATATAAVEAPDADAPDSSNGPPGKSPRKRAKRPRGEATVESDRQGRPGFSCQHCKYKVARLKTLELHLRRKHKDVADQSVDMDSNSGQASKKTPKPHTCSTCSASFVQEKSLKCHMRQHVTPIPIRVQPAPSPIVISVITYAGTNKRVPG